MRMLFDLVVRFFEILSERGLLVALSKLAFYPYRAVATLRGRWQFERDVLSIEDPQKKFTWIFEKNAWGSQESRSGPGSTLRNTEQLRAELPAILREFQVRTLLDAPCGDFNWMSHVVDQLDCSYIGIDIVPALIDSNKANHGRDGVEFIQGDIMVFNFPYADMLICRDCLFHLSYIDIKKTLDNFLRSGIQYFMTTTHITEDDFRNKDISTGDWRRINLFLAPFYFPVNVKRRIDDTGAGAYKREMCIWDRAQIKSAVDDMESALRTHCKATSKAQ